MKRWDFMLIGLTARNGRVRFTGPLGEVLGRGLKRHQAAFLVASLFARLKRGKPLDLVGMSCSIDKDSVFRARPTGLFGRFAAAGLIRGIEDWVNGKGRPIARRDGALVYTSYHPPMPSHAAMKLLANRFANERYGHPLPTTATLQVTVRCQANCEHCSAARHRRAGTNELTTDQWKFIIRQCEDVGAATIVFTGGEPLLRQDIFELISSVREDEAVALMFSNGLLLTEENVRKLKDAGLDAIHVSIDSPNADINDALRRIPGCFDKAMAGLRRMKAAGIMTGISTYATPDSLRKGDVHRMIELAREAGCDELTISDLVPMGRLLKEDACLLLSDTDKDELCRIEEEQNAKNEPPHIITQGHINGTTGVGCFAGWSQLYITAYGDVTPCDFTPLRFGDCLREPLLDIWKRLAGHKAYVNRSRCCRMQDPVFRSKYIDSVPDRGPFPYPIELLGVEPRALAESRERKCSSLGVRG